MNKYKGLNIAFISIVSIFIGFGVSELFKLNKDVFFVIFIFGFLFAIVGVVLHFQTFSKKNENENEKSKQPWE